MIDLIIPSLKKEHAWKCIESLRNIPFGIKLHLMVKENSWPGAINAGIKESENDVLIMDDDIEILPNTFKDFEKYYELGDIFGFKLLFPDGKIQHAGGMIKRNSLGHIGYGELDKDNYSHPMEVSHVTASLIYIKRKVIDELKMIETSWPGVQFEDVDFNLRALKAGFKIIYIPNIAIHGESQSKKHSSDFWDKFRANQRSLIQKYWFDKELMDKLDGFPKVITC